MFSLIITSAAIVLVAALALATIFYGSDAFNKGTEKAMAARAIQEGNQIIAALEVYRADTEALPSGDAETIKNTLLSGDYLKQWPNNEWTLETGYAKRTGLNESECLAVNQRVGVNTVPLCSDSTYANRIICCDDGL